MRSIVISLVVVLGILSLDGCFTPPTYSVVPKIDVLNDQLYFAKAPANSNRLDSLVVSVKFQDGDGDLGIDDSYTDPIYAQQYYVVYDQQGRYFRTTLTTLSGYSYINYRFKKKNPTFNLFNLPEYDCKSWQQITNKSGAVIDTFYIQSNAANYYNYFVSYYIKNNATPSDTSYTKFDVYKYFAPNCPDATLIGGRFPVLSSDPGKKAPLDGSLSYSIKSFGFENIFSTKTLKLRVYIQDRAFNKSNVVETKDFTLQSIRR